MTKNIRAVLFDIDGVLEYQGQVMPGAVEMLGHLRLEGLQIRFLTNSTLKSRASCAAKLRRSGFTVDASEVFTASYASAQYLRDQNAKTVWIMAEREGLDEFRDFAQDDRCPEYVVIGDNRSRFDFDHLNQALRMLVSGAKLIAMQDELTDGSMGALELNVGSWSGMLERACGQKAVCVGKPSPYMFELALRSLGCERGQVIMVGDRVSADVMGAKNTGLRSVLMKTGEFRPSDLNGLLQPDWVLDAVADLPGLIHAVNRGER